MVTDRQITIIKQDLIQKGITMPGLENDLLDHLLCGVEMYMTEGYSFDEAYRYALHDLHGDLEITTIQQETIYMVNEGKSVFRNLVCYGAILGLLIFSFNLFTTGVNPGLILVCISLSIFFIYHSIFQFRKKNSFRSNVFLFRVITSISVFCVFIFLCIEFEGNALIGMVTWVSLIIAIAVPFYLKAVKTTLLMNSTVTTFFAYTLKLTAIISLLWIPLALCLKLFRPDVAILFFLDDLLLLAACTLGMSFILSRLTDLKVYLQKNL